MEFLKLSWRQIRVQVEQMPQNVKWLIGVTLVCMAALLLLVLQYAGSPDDVEITGFATAEHAEVEIQLKIAGIAVRSEGGQLLVPSDQHLAALQILASSDLMAQDISNAFDELIKNSTIWDSTAQFNKKEQWVRQDVLGMIIKTMKDVRSAEVMLDIPIRVGFSHNHVRPSAAVNVVMRGRKSLNRGMVEAIAGLVSSAVAAMKPQDVVVIDANAGRHLTVKDVDEFSPEDTMVTMKNRNDYWEGKVYDMLRYIQRVIVAVNVQQENVGKKVSEIWKYAPETVISTENNNSNRISQSQEGEPGARSNTAANIAGGSGELLKEIEELERKNYGPPPMTQEDRIQYVGQTIEKINASIGVPHSHLVSLFNGREGQAPDDPNAEPAAPTDEFIQAQLAKIHKAIQPILDQRSPGLVEVYMYDDGPMLIAVARLGPGPTGVGGLIGQWARPAGLSVLALSAVGLMFAMVRKAVQSPPLPTAEELAGVPSVLDDDEELVGQADESELSMAGMEVSDADVRSRHVANQISELVKANPEEAAHLVGKWVEVEDY